MHLAPPITGLYVRGSKLILRKISKIGATRCQTLGLQCTKFAFRWGLIYPSPTRGAYSAPPDPLALFKGPTFKEREKKGRAEEGEGKEM